MSLVLLGGLIVFALVIGILAYQYSKSEPNSEEESVRGGPGRDVPGAPPDDSPPVD